MFPIICQTLLYLGSVFDGRSPSSHHRYRSCMEVSFWLNGRQEIETYPKVQSLLNLSQYAVNPSVATPICCCIFRKLLMAGPDFFVAGLCGGYYQTTMPSNQSLLFLHFLWKFCFIPSFCHLSKLLGYLLIPTQ